MTRRLVGVRVGPGDPELVTVKAVKVLRTAEVVFVPVADTGDIGRAEATVRAHVPHRDVRRLVFAMSEAASRDDAWNAAGAVVAAALDRTDTTVAFATIGDPNVYSTFSYLAQTVRALRPDVAVETVPGITAMQDLAARSATVLVEGTETLALLPLTAGLDRLEHALTAHDTVVAYKGGRMLPAVLDAVRAAGRIDAAVYGAALGLPGEEVCPAGQLDPRHAPYLSTLIVPPRRAGRGNRL